MYNGQFFTWGTHGKHSGCWPIMYWVPNGVQWDTIDNGIQPTNNIIHIYIYRYIIHIIALFVQMPGTQGIRNDLEYTMD